MDELIDVDALIEALLEREGGYVDNPADKGGPTCFGITQAVARANGYCGPMRQLPKQEAAEIYKRLYWLRPGWTRWRGAVAPSRPSSSTPASTWGPQWRSPSSSGR